jgi:hypothetical protein
MNFSDRASMRSAYIFAALIVAVPCFPALAQELAAKVATAALPQTLGSIETEAEPKAQEDGFIGPRFRKGLWVFKRTLDVVRNANKNVKYRLAQNEVTRCVDPTHSMKATFSSAPVGSCVSDKPEKVGNKYTFGKRCDYLGAVSTVITVHDDDSYTELNELSAGDSPKTDLVIAKRIGDCGDGKAEVTAKASVSALQQ